MRNCTMLLIGFAVLACAGSYAQDGPPARDLPLTRAALVHAAPAEHAGSVDLDLEHIEKEYGRAVVKILFTYIENLDEIKDDPRQNESFGGYNAHGSGFFINAAGYILTNAHVVDNANRRTIRCRTQATGNSEFELELIGVGETNNVDLALLRLKASEKPRFLKLAGFAGIPFLSIADSDRVAKTEQIAIMGYPEDSDDLRAKAANLSGRQYLDCPFQYLEVATASAVKSGNSGGAAVNRWGEVSACPPGATGPTAPAGSSPPMC
jgi:S1-C subfamily serine protease